METELTPTTLARSAGISVSYASQIMGGQRAPSRTLAVHIFDVTGAKFGALARVSDDDARALVRIERQAEHAGDDTPGTADPSCGNADNVPASPAEAA